MRWFAPLFVLIAATSACDKKHATPSASASASASPPGPVSASASVSASTSGSSAGSHPGACKQLLGERATRCDAMAKGDPTIEQACKEAIDRLSTVGDDARCWNAMNPPDTGPPQDDEPE